jgi:hypothetical protein
MTTLFSSPSKQGQQAASASEGISAQEMQQLQDYINTTNANLRGAIGGGDVASGGSGGSSGGAGGGFITYGDGGQSIKSVSGGAAATPVAYTPQGPPSQSGIVASPATAPVANPTMRRTT